MARDYARNRHSRRNARGGEVTPRGGRRPSGQRGYGRYRQPSKTRPALWLISGILLGLLLAGIFYFNRQPHLTNTLTTTVPSENSNKTRTKGVKAGKNTAHHANRHHTVDTEMDTEADGDYDAEENDTVNGDNDEIESNEPAKDPAHQENRTKKKTAEATEPQYEFYTMLPKDQVETSEPETKEQPEEKVRPDIKKSTPTHYQLQVAAMSKYPEADHLKAQLILQGYNATITKQVQNGTTRFRVNVGPYNSLKEAQAQQLKLRKNHLNSILSGVKS